MPIYRIVSLVNGEMKQEDFRDLKSLLKIHEQTGVEEDSYTLRLHGEPHLKGLIGPMSEGKAIVRYESPEAYAILTEKWAKARKKADVEPATD